MDNKLHSPSTVNRAALGALPAGAAANTSRRQLIAAGTLIFLAALCVRLLHWQDYQLNIGADQGSLVSRYKQQARRMLDGHGVLYPTGYQEHRSVQLLVHPPGYSIFIAIIYWLFGESDNHLVFAQIVCDSLAAVLVFLIAARGLPIVPSVIAGALISFSPHLAHQSLMLLPESLAVLPILLAVYLLVRTRQRARLWVIVAAGAMVGLSCWLRSNGLLLALFFAVAILLLFEPGRRLKYSAAFVAAALAVISPITIRNWIVFGHFIPLSLGSGVTMIEGIADYDTENRFGMPATDDEAARKDADWHHRPDYALGLWRPDGIERDRYRFARGLDVIRQNPVWFAGVMIRRGASMLRYNDSLSLGWPADTARAPLVASEPPFGHQLATEDKAIWTRTADQLLVEGKVLSARATVLLSEDRETLTIAGDDSAFDDQFSSTPIPVDMHTDYLLKAPIRVVEGRMAAKVTNTGRNIALASRILLQPANPPDPDVGHDKLDEDSPVTPQSPLILAEDQRLYTVLPFATGNRSEVVLVISNDGQSSVPPKTSLGEVQLFKLGQTPHQWLRAVRPLVRGLERNVYKTFRMLPLIGVGIVLLLARRRWWLLVCWMVVPAYYLLVQSALHTEYRYVLAMHYFLLSMAAVTLWCAGMLINRASLPAVRRIKSLVSNRL